MFGLLAPVKAKPILQPEWPGAPSGFATPPKPYQFRGHHLDGRRFQPGEEFHVDLLQYAAALAIRPAMETALERVKTEGLGPGRGRLQWLATETGTIECPLDPQAVVHRLHLRFLTPADIDPHFDTLIARVQDRINAIAVCYAGAPYQPRLPRTAVTLTVNRTQPIARTRLSTRTGQQYGTGGLIGELEYQGDLTTAAPWLQAGQWTGAGGGAYEILAAE